MIRSTIAIWILFLSSSFPLTASDDITMICDGQTCRYIRLDTGTTATFDDIMAYAVADIQHTCDSLSTHADNIMAGMHNCTSIQQRDSIINLYMNGVQPELLRALDLLEVRKATQLGKMNFCNEWAALFKELSEQSYYNRDDNTELRDSLRHLYTTLSPIDARHPDITEAHACLYPPKPLQPGDAMADGDFVDRDGNRHRLNDYTGKYILLDFWESTCGACLMSLPELAGIASTMTDSITVIGINTESVDSWRQFTATRPYPGIDLHQAAYTYRSPLGVPMYYRVSGYPTFVLISPDGTVVRQCFGYRQGMLKDFANPALPYPGT